MLQLLVVKCFTWRDVSKANSSWNIGAKWVCSYCKGIFLFVRKREGIKDKIKEHLSSIDMLDIGVAGKDVRKLAKEIIALLDREFNELSLEKLMQIHGLGVAKASVILASLELSRRYLIKARVFFVHYP